MNIACNRKDDNLPILFVDFNQDFTSIQVGTKTGYSLLSTTGDQITETFSTTSDPICIVARLFNRSLTTLVSRHDMRKLLVSHSRINTLICHYRYTLTILAVKMNHQRLVVCVEDGIFIHNIRDMQMLHKVEETPPNKNGVMALSSAKDNCYLAYPGSHRVGTVFIFDALNFQNITSISAHDGLLAALAFNSKADLLATASEKGTVIRVFSIPQGDKLVEFRRGLSRCVSICSLSFSLNNQYLVSASHTETLHVFKLDGISSDKPMESVPHTAYARCRTNSSSSITAGVRPEDTAEPSASAGDTSTAVTGSWTGGLLSWVGTTLKSYSSYLPHQVSEILTQDRAFAYAHLPSATMSTFWPADRASPVTVRGAGELIGTGTQQQQQQTVQPQPVGLHKVAAVVEYQGKPRLIVAGLDGLVHTFAIDPVAGGEAQLLHTQRLLSPNPTAPEQSAQTSEANLAISGSPQSPPGIYVAGGSQRATTFAAAVAGVTSELENARLDENDDGN